MCAAGVAPNTMHRAAARGATGCALRSTAETASTPLAPCSLLGYTSPMRGIRFLTFTELPESAYAIPGVHRTKRGDGTLVPWHAYHLVTRLVPGGVGWKRLGDNALLPIPAALAFSEDPLSQHPLVSDATRYGAREYQRADFKAALENRGGLIDWPTGSGKTLLGLAYATAYLRPEAVGHERLRSVIVVPSTTTSQWYAQAERWLDTTKVKVGFITSGRPEVKKVSSRVWRPDARVIDDVTRHGPEGLALLVALRAEEGFEDGSLSAAERDFLKRIKCPYESAVTWRVVDDLGNVLSSGFASEEAAVASLGEWSPGDYDVLVVGWGLMSNVGLVQALIRWQPAVLVVDEAHRAKDHKRWVKEQTAEGEPDRYRRRTTASANIALLSGDTPAVLLLTATPQSDLPKDWWGLLDLYDPYGFGSFHEFSVRYCAGYQGEYAWNSDGMSNVEELRSRFALFRYHREKSETHKDLPRLVREFSVLTLRDAGAVDFEVLGQELRSEEYGGSPVAMGIAVATEQKIPWALDRLSQYLREGLKVVVFVLLRANMRTLVDKIRALKGLPEDVLVLEGDGSVAVENRQLLVQTLTTHPRGGVLVGTLGAWGESIDGLQHVDRAIMLTLPWTPRMFQQAEGRFERIGGKSSVTIEFPRLAGTIDDRIWTKLGFKLDMVAEIREDTDAKDLGLELRGISEGAEAAALEDLAKLLGEWADERPEIHQEEAEGED